jgi:hypothetical protein
MTGPDIRNELQQLFDLAARKGDFHMCRSLSPGYRPDDPLPKLELTEVITTTLTRCSHASS